MCFVIKNILNDTKKVNKKDFSYQIKISISELKFLIKRFSKFLLIRFFFKFLGFLPKLLNSRIPSVLAILIKMLESFQKNKTK